MKRHCLTLKPFCQGKVQCTSSFHSREREKWYNCCHHTLCTSTSTYSQFVQIQSLTWLSVRHAHFIFAPLNDDHDGSTMLWMQNFHCHRIKKQKFVAWKSSHIGTLTTSLPAHININCRSSTSVGFKLQHNIYPWWRDAGSLLTIPALSVSFSPSTILWWEIVLQHLFSVIISIFLTWQLATILSAFHSAGCWCYAINYLIPFDQMSNNFRLGLNSKETNGKYDTHCIQCGCNTQ